MTGVLERIFQMALLMTIVLLVMNLFLATFAYPLTGETRFGTTTSDTSLEKLEGTPTSAIGDEIRQDDDPPLIPPTNKTDWNNLWSVIASLTTNTQTLVDIIAADIIPTETGDAAEQVGDTIILVINLIQLAGAAYLPWALASALTGGGSP